MKGTDIILQLWWYGASTLPVQPTFFRYLLQAGNEPFLLWYLPLSCFLSLHNSLYLSTQHLNTAKTAWGGFWQYWVSFAPTDAAALCWSVGHPLLSCSSPHKSWWCRHVQAPKSRVDGSVAGMLQDISRKAPSPRSTPNSAWRKGCSSLDLLISPRCLGMEQAKKLLIKAIQHKTWTSCPHLESGCNSTFLACKGTVRCR